MSKLFGCEVIHTQKASVTVEAKSLKEAKEKLARGDYLDLDHHASVSMVVEEGTWQSFGKYE